MPIAPLLAKPGDPTTLATEDDAPSGALPSSTRLDRRRRQRLQMLATVAASYLVDTLLLLLLAAAGALHTTQALAYAAAGTCCCAAFFLLLRSGWTERFRDHYLVVPQMLANSLINMSFILWVPQAGGLLLMVLFVIVGFGSLRMGLRQVMLGALTIALVMGALLAHLGNSLAIPLDGPAQRILSGLWFSSILARTALLGLYGSSLRVLLTRRNAELAATFAKLEQLASRDSLTGTLNRRSLMQTIETEAERQRRHRLEFGVALFDLDCFKQINDGHGHLVGDEVLRRFAELASRELRAGDQLGRFGGEEFLVVLCGPADAQAAAIAAERVRRVIEQHDWSAVGEGLRVTVSAGVSLHRENDRPEQLLARADAALYTAKREGRNRIVLT